MKLSTILTSVTLAIITSPTTAQADCKATPFVAECAALNSRLDPAVASQISSTCSCDLDPLAVTLSHGAYITCVRNLVNPQTTINKKLKKNYIKAAAQSNCGKSDDGEDEEESEPSLPSEPSEDGIEDPKICSTITKAKQCRKKWNKICAWEVGGVGTGCGDNPTPGVQFGGGQQGGGQGQGGGGGQAFNNPGQGGRAQDGGGQAQATDKCAKLKKEKPCSKKGKGACSWNPGTSTCGAAPGTTVVASAQLDYEDVAALENSGASVTRAMSVVVASVLMVVFFCQ